MVSAMADIVSALEGPAALVIVPIAASAVLAIWVHDVYQTSYAPLFVREPKDIDTSRCFSASCPILAT